VFNGLPRFKPGRLWAVEGRPRATNDDHQRPLCREPALHRRRSREVAPAPHHFLRNKKQEWEEYRSEVTAFELRKNLPVL
jgi:glutamine synthetase